MLMVKNVFISSMYFFIPLKRVSADYIETKERKYEDIKTPHGVHESIFRCAYYSGIEDRKKHFYFNHHSQWMKVEVIPYILKYQINRDSEAAEHFLITKVDIDKWIPTKTISEFKTQLEQKLCEEEDIVCLKKEFYENGENALHESLDKNDSNTHKEWAKNLVREIEDDEEREIYFRYSLVNITSEAIDISIEDQIENNFSAKYYEYPHQEFEKNIVGDYRRFAYGVLFGNDNYMRLHKKELERIIGNSYSNNDTEMTYAGHMTVLFIKTHTPYEHYPEPLPQKHSPSDLRNLQDVYEICSALFIEKQMENVRNVRNNEINPLDVKIALSSLMEQLNANIFYMRSADEKAHYIYEALGLLKEYENVKKIAELKIEAGNYQITQKTNSDIKWLTYAMFGLGLLQMLCTLYTLLHADKNDNLFVKYTILGFFLVIYLFLMIAFATKWGINRIRSGKREMNGKLLNNVKL